MKRIVFFLVILLVVGFVSCKKEQLLSPTHTIDISSGPGGTPIPCGKIEVTYRDSLRVYFKPDPGNEVDTIIADKIIIIRPRPSFVFWNVMIEHELRVTFKEIHTPI